MEKIFFWYVALSIVFPGLTWGQDNPGDNVKYNPRMIPTGNISAVKDNYGDIVRYQYNPIEDYWKFCANNSTLKYNPMENKWTYAYPREVLRFNPAENNWDYHLPEAELRYHLINENWWYGYNPPRKGVNYLETFSPTTPHP